VPATISIYDTYRIVLLTEVSVVAGMYVWAFVQYAYRIRAVDEGVLRRFRYGQACRVLGVLVLLLLFALAIVASFGRGDIGRTIYNLILQFALILFVVAWGLVDLPRFRAIDGRPHAAIYELNRIDAEAIQRRKAREGHAP
jgi:hypothetical protein